jgi:hypothetical protein
MGMRKRYPVLKIIFTVIAVALFLFGAMFFIESQKGYAQFRAWLEARPVSIKVDFSKPGTYTSNFEQTCSVSHGEIFGLELPKSALDNKEINYLLEGLNANCVITDANGNEFISLALPDPNTYRKSVYFDNLVTLNQEHPFENGTYHISISVSKGAPALSGIEQKFVARYLLCGIERLPADISRLASIVCFIVGGVTVLTMFLMAVRKARKNRQPAPAQKPL